METKKTTVAGAVKIILQAMVKCLVSIIQAVLRSVLKFDREVLKRYLNIETPLYKIWWNAHALYLQKKLDEQHGTTIVKNLKSV